MTLIAAGFLATLVFTGVQPLWDTQFATTLLLIAFGSLVVLLNAAYQDGHTERATPRVLRYPGSLAALTLAPCFRAPAISPLPNSPLYVRAP